MSAVKTEVHALQNDSVRVAFDAAGNLIELTNRRTGHNYAGGHPIWRLCFQQGEKFDREILGRENASRVISDGQAIELVCEQCRFEEKTLDIALRLKVELVGDEVRFAAELRNEAAGIVLRDFHFPVIHGLKRQAGEELIVSRLGGMKFADIEREIRKEHTLWKGNDHLFITKSYSYPSSEAATNCFVFAGESEGLYWGVHNAAIETTEHVFRMYGDELDVALVRFPGCGCGESWRLDGYVVSPYCGTWHAAAKKYRSWAESTWFRTHDIPAWVKTMTGWQRIIMKHQYGEVHYGYDRLPEIREDGQKAGVDTLFMFGWQQGGHDNNYPEYVPDPELGTVAELKNGVADFNRHGGDVILYSNGQLIDTDSKFLKNGGDREAIRDFHGNMIKDAYYFRGNGVFYNKVAFRSFVHACPYSEKWEEVLRGVIDTAHELGCRSAFFDQLGNTCYPCCSPDHGHPVPAFAVGYQRSRQIKRLREYAREYSSEMAVGIEILADITAMEADYIHSLSGFCGAKNDWEKSGKKPETDFFIDWFRYLFPEVIMTDREIRDDSDIERRVNHTVLKGLRNDVEIYRCRRSIAETPHYQEYLGRANALRKKHAGLLLEGRYCDTDHFTLNNPEIEARSFVNGDRLAVVLTQSHLESATAMLTVPGWRLTGNDGLNGVTVKSGDDGITVVLQRHGLAILTFNRE